MKLPLFVFCDELFSEYEIKEDDTFINEVCSDVLLFTPGTILRDGTLYVMPFEQLDAFCRTRGSQMTIFGAVYSSGCLPANAMPGCLFFNDGRQAFESFFNKILQIFFKCTSLELELMKCNQNHAPFKDYLRLAFPMIQNPLILYDNNYVIIADTRGEHPLPDDSDWLALTSAGYWTPEIRTTALLDMGDRTFPIDKAYYYESDRFFHNFALMHINSGEQMLAIICSHEIFTPITRTSLFYIDILGNMLRDRLKEQQESINLDQDAFKRFIQTMLQPNNFSQEYIISQLTLVGWKINDHYCMIIFSDQTDFLHNQYFPKRIRSIFQNSYTISVDNCQAAIICLKGVDSLVNFSELTVFLRDAVVKCGVSNILYSFGDLRIGYQQCKAALTLGQKLQPTRWIHEFEDYAIDYLLHFAMEAVNYQSLCHPAVLQLQKEDEKNDTHYLDTLSLYLSSEKNLGKIADQLFIHRNTLMHRLEKIKALTNIDYDDTQAMEHILLSIRICKLHNNHIF